MAEAQANVVESRVAQAMEEYKDSDAFKANVTVVTAEAYNLGFNDYKKDVIDAFPSLDLRRITLMGELKEDKEEDVGEEPTQVIGGDDASEEVVEFHQLQRSRRLLLWLSLQRSLTPLRESNLENSLPSFFSSLYFFIFFLGSFGLSFVLSALWFHVVNI